jgi:hypothetical protein
MTDIVGKLWGFCHMLRHDGIDYGDYIEQLTYLLFLKMAEEKVVIGTGSHLCIMTPFRIFEYLRNGSL